MSFSVETIVAPHRNHLERVRSLHTMPVICSGTCKIIDVYALLMMTTYFSPETVESLFIAYRLTGDPRYREHGWRIFQSIEKHCRVETGGYATIVNVDEVPAKLEDRMETFLMVCSFLSP